MPTSVRSSRSSCSGRRVHRVAGDLDAAGLDLLQPVDAAQQRALAGAAAADDARRPRPRSTLSETPLSTSTAPKLLWTSSTSTTGIELPFQAAAAAATADSRSRSRSSATGDEDLEGLEGRVVDQLPGAGQLDEADDRDDRGVLDQLHQEADGRRQRDAHRLRQDDVAVLLRPGAAPATPRPPIAAAARPGCSRARSRRDRRWHRSTSRPRRRRAAATRSRASTGRNRQEQHHQHRDALDTSDVAGGELARSGVAGQCGRARRRTPSSPPSTKASTRQQQRPAAPSAG